MKKKLRSVILVSLAALFGLLVGVFHPHAQEIEEDEEAATVSETDLQMYIKVYTAMQADHGLAIDTAIQPHAISLDDFRQIERRIQGDARMVERVRSSLLEYAKSHSALGETVTETTPTPAPVAERPRGSKRSRKATR